MEGANLTHAHLEGANLTDANLTNAILAYADLTNAYLLNANLTGADLKGARLDGADLTVNLPAYLTSVKGLTQEQLDRACGTGVKGLQREHYPALTIKPCQ